MSRTGSEQISPEDLWDAEDEMAVRNSLDHAVNQFGQRWSCSQCPYRNIKSIDELEYGANGELLDHEFSPDIIKKIRGNESG